MPTTRASSIRRAIARRTSARSKRICRKWPIVPGDFETDPDKIDNALVRDSRRAHDILVLHPPHYPRVASNAGGILYAEPMSASEDRAKTQRRAVFLFRLRFQMLVRIVIAGGGAVVHKRGAVALVVSSMRSVYAETQPETAIRSRSLIIE